LRLFDHFGDRLIAEEHSNSIVNPDSRRQLAAGNQAAKVTTATGFAIKVR
jgi:hypothetical protein